jgi:hypothetical protein
MTLPWEGGAVWRYMNGPHSGSGEVADALDFQPPDAAGQRCEAFTSAFWAVAAADGRATVMPNAVEVDHGNGYRTGYYHLADKQVKSGDTVAAGQRLGHPGCCPDGVAGEDCWATEPHLHFYTSGPTGRQPIAGQHVGGWLVDADGCLVRPDRRACRGASLISNSPRFEGEAGSSVAATVAIDTSASMDGGISGVDLPSLVSPYLMAAAEGEPVTVITFDSRSRVVPVEKGADVPSLLARIRGSSSKETTDLLSGLGRACSEMKLRGPEVKQFLVLITDGFHNAGRLQDPARCFQEHGWRVFAISPRRANSGLLGRIASATGGEYRAAASIFDAACELQRLRAISAGMGDTSCSHFLLMPGDRLSVPFSVPPEQAQASIVLTAAAVGGSMSETKVSMVLRMPGGKTLADEGTLARESDGRSERYAVARPGAGMWEAVVSGRDLPADGVLVDLSFVTTPLVYAYGVEPPEASEPAPTPVSAGEIPTSAAEESETPTPTPTPTPTRRPRATFPPTNTPTPAATLPVTQTPSR